eukprot:TRINITY_DN2419_c2_g1_i1.p1 TRINITY_DN2419_c2_g1~~TRINITY_DN2419_c2_g1_i1.p1  ORF type:complete len:141 (+),score=0.73 TRINITY_DN2419_c2_g1_i1:86-508(+)
MASLVRCDHALTLAHPISTILNPSIREGYLPAIWRSTIVIPFLKVNPPRNISKDLRQISLTAALSKQLVGGWMLDYIVDGLVVNRYGGLRGLSTTHALIDIVHTWLLAAEEGKLDTWSFGLPKSFRSRGSHSSSQRMHNL